MKLSTIYYVFIILYIIITLLFISLMNYHTHNFADHINIINIWFVIIMLYNTSTLIVCIILSKALKSIKDQIDTINTFSSLPTISNHYFIKDIKNVYISCNILSIRLIEYHKMMIFIQKALLDKNKIIADKNIQLEEVNKQLLDINKYLATLQKISNKNMENYLKGDQ